MTLTRLTVVGLGMGALAPPAAAQQDSTTILAPIVVSAHHHPTPREMLTNRVTVLDGAALRAQGITSVADALRAVPGLHVVGSGSFGGATSVFVRGGESDFVRVLVDGIPVNEPGGSYDFAHLATDNVDRIEVVRGPVSVVHGSDAVTGVVNIVTRAGHGAPTVSAGARAGTFGTVELDVEASGGNEQAGYGVQVRRLTSDGAFAFNNAYRNASAGARFRLAVDEQTDVRFTARYADAEYHFPTDGAGFAVDSNQFTAYETTTLGLEVGRQFTPWIRGRVQLDVHEIASLFDDQPDGPADTIGFTSFRSDASLRRRRADGRVVLTPTAAAALTAGIAVEQEWQRTDRDRHRDHRAYYAQLVAGPLRGLSGTAGVRVDDNERFGTFTTLRVGAAFRLAQTGTRFHTSAGTAFKEPTFLETFDNAFSIGNPDLEPERSRSVELGVEQPLAAGRVVLTATAFDQQFTNLIQYTFAPSAPDDPNYFNVAAADVRGVELELHAAPVGAVRMSASYSYLRTAVTDSGFDAGPDAAFVVGDRLLRRPTHSAAVQATYRVTSALGVSARVRRVGSRDDRDFSAFPARRVTLPAHAVVDLAFVADLFARRGARPGVGLTARVENLFDERFQEIVGFPGRGRTVLLGGRLAY